MMAKRTSKAIWSEALSRLFWLFAIFVAAWIIMAGGLFIKDNLKRWTATYSLRIEPGNLPINKVDPISGKPIMPGITSTYQQHIIGHCCVDSKIEWKLLNPEQKAAKIQGFL